MGLKKYLLIAVIAVLLDQAAKWVVYSFVPKGQHIAVIITHTENTGAGFSLFAGMNHILLWLNMAILGAIIYYFANAKKEQLLPLALIIGGGAGNLIDRIIHGHVIDFIDLGFWPVFNLADSFVTAGAVLFIIMLLKEKSTETKKQKTSIAQKSTSKKKNQKKEKNRINKKHS